MTDLPIPPVDGTLDLRDFRWMKLDLIALLNSEFNHTTNDTAWRAGVTLWARAWHQVPAGSLPDDDAKLCSLAGLGRDLRTWRTIRETALHGFVKCDDERLYHRFICDLAIEAATERQRYRDRKKADRVRKAAERSTLLLLNISESDARNSNGHRADISDVSQGIPYGNSVEGALERKKESPPKPPKKETGLSADEITAFEAWWRVYPYRVGKKAAKANWRLARSKASLAILIEGAQRYSIELSRPNPPKPKHPQGWLSEERWADELPGLEKPQEEWERMGMGSPGFG